jgi:hypothetical protein
MSSRLVPRSLSLTLIAALCLQGAAPAWAGAASALSDLVGAKGAGGESELERRGYTHIDSHKSGGTAYSYWWSNAKGSCVRVSTRDGRYQSVMDTDASDCGQTKKESGMSDGAKVAVGAAALLGLAALVHKSHHRDDRNFNEQQTADFERGYRDGLYNNNYHNYGNNREYSDGYGKGVEERSQNSSYRGGSYGRGGYQAFTNISDLKGRDAQDARRQLENRGFFQTGERDQGRSRFHYYYWNNRTSQCADLYVKDGRIDGAWDVDDGVCGR